MKFSQALVFLRSLEKFGIKPGLSRIKKVLLCLDNPHRKFKSIHIAGTNGKGSTAAFLEALLRQKNFQVGLYTSPHLVSFCERIRLNGCDISQNDFARLISIIQQVMIREKIVLTVFEVLTAAAFLCFAEKKVDYAVIETGLGGRWDATNVVIPQISAITNIELEHTEILGSTIEKIAYEKAGIIKRGKWLATAEKKPQALKVFQKIIKLKKAAGIIQVTKKFSGNLPLLGAHQKANMQLALQILNQLQFSFRPKEIKKALKLVKWPGRLQIIKGQPEIILDGAHNPAGIEALVKAIKQMPVKSPLVILLGILKSKDIPAMLKILSKLKAQIIVTNSTHPQSAGPEYFPGYFYEKDQSKALALALKKAGSGRLLVCGSLYLIGDLKTV